MKIPSLDKLEKLEHALRKMVVILKCNRELVIHQAIDQFYYMQKAEEVRVLREQLQNSKTQRIHLEGRLCKYHQEIFNRWRNDARWLNRHLYKSLAEID